MKKLFFIMSTVFAIICFSWAGYVLYMGGEVNPGVAIISMVASLCCSQAYRSILDTEKKNIISAGIKTIGRVTNVKKCWWIKVNTKPVRTHLLDGAVFPHIIYFTYTVNNIDYTGKKYVSYKSVPPTKNAEIEVYYDSNNPKMYVFK